MKRCVIVRLTIEAVADAMGLPSDMKVNAIVPQDEYDLLHGTVRAIVEGPGLPEVLEGEQPKTVVLPLEL